MQPKIINDPNELIRELETIHQRQEGYVFRGLPNSKFYLEPSAFRNDVIRKRIDKFPTASLYREWCVCNDLKKMMLPPYSEDYTYSLHTQRVCELTFYVMNYNYNLAKYVQKNKEKFDPATLRILEIHPVSYWESKDCFLRLFEYGFLKSIGRVDLNGKVINYSIISEELTGYDESLPQHYDTPTATLDCTRNPYIALYFALKRIPADATHVSIYAYRQLQDSEKNPIIMRSDLSECINPRIIRQEGLFICLRYACSYYFIHGKWPSIETFLPVSEGFFELMQLKVPVCHADALRLALNQKGITEEYLFPDLYKVVQ